MEYFIRDTGRAYPRGSIVRAAGEPGRLELIPAEDGDEEVVRCTPASTIVPGRWLTVVTRPRGTPGWAAR